MRRLLGGSPLERTASNLHAAEIDLLRARRGFCEGSYRACSRTRAHLAAEDPRRQAMEAICSKEATGKLLTEEERNTVIAVSRAANSALRREIVQVRSFRNVLYATAIVLAVVAIGLVVLSASQPELIPLCFHPGDAVVCPTTAVDGVAEDAPEAAGRRRDRWHRHRWDVPLVAALGLRGRRPICGTQPAQAPGHDAAVLAASSAGRAQAAQWRADSSDRPAAHARGVRAGADRSRQPGADPGVGRPVRLRATAVHAVHRSACARTARSGQQPGLASRGRSESDGGHARSRKRPRRDRDDDDRAKT